MHSSVPQVVRRGARTALRSWPGALVVLAVALTWQGAWSFMLTATEYPREALQPAGQEQALDVLPSPLVQEPAQFETEVGTDTLGAESPLAEEQARRLQEEQTALLQAWIGTAWPVLLIMYAVGFLGFAWLSGGQLGYLAAQLKGRTGLSTFLESGNEKFLPVVQTLGLMVGLGIAASLVFTFVMALAVAIGGGGVLGLLLESLCIVSASVGLAWLGVKLMFWVIAVVVDTLRPVDALKASFAVVRGRWWRAFAVLVVWMLIAMGVGLCLQGLGWVFKVWLDAGQASLVTDALAAATSVLLGFGLNASLIVWYQEVQWKSDAGSFASAAA